MKKRTILSIIFALSMVIVPLSIYAVDYYPSDHKGLLPKCNEGPIDAVTGDYLNPCGFDSLMAMINKLIDFITLQLVTPLFAVIFIFAGVLYLSAGAKPDNKTRAKKIIFNSLKGFGLVLASWVIVKTILLTLGYRGPWFL
ncbi:MAG TPA: pilin [Candidatus Paceibacterota bacterium]|jgi:hypothetical protein|nr:pilin [Candidatus Paceibacterota bacterium]HPC12571.1 pilin [Candidatus Paceibacterota bacterium]HQO70838.1 pilin [Candidatus Paceibacterota bacterium]HQQ21998.1 pilin [Candidatus Paceibacterota bacterium]